MLPENLRKFLTPMQQKICRMIYTYMFTSLFLLCIGLLLLMY